MEKSVTLYVFMIIICAICSSLVSVSRSTYDRYHSAIKTAAGVDINHYLVKPDLPLYVNIVIILCGTFSPAVTGIALLKVRKERRQRVRVLHFITTVPGFLCCATLTCLDAMTVGDVGNVDCSFTASHNCYCGTGLNRYHAPVLVCHLFAIRLVYIVFISLATLCAVICFLVIACWAHKNERPKIPRGDNPGETPRRRPRRIKRQDQTQHFQEYITKQYDMMMV